MESLDVNVVEVIPYDDFKQKVKLVKQEERKNRYVEVWDGVIYSAVKRRC